MSSDGKPVLQKPAGSVLDLIGNTPMVRVSHLDTGPCELYLKLESQNPGGSIKDRIGLEMIHAAEDEGELKPGGTIIEATAGNTGLGLALVAAQKGYKLKLVIPDKMSRDKIMHLQALGAEVILTRSDVAKGHPEYYQDVALRLASETPGSFFVNQFANEANPRAHEKTTAPEIWQQMDGRIDAFVAGVGSGGTITGIGRYLKRQDPKVEIIVADPEGSIVADAVNTGSIPNSVGSWVVEGIGEDFIPDTLDLGVVDRGITVGDKEALMTGRDLLRKEGILGGSSSGTLIAAALRYCREQTSAKRVVTFVCDTGNKYLNKAYNDYWMEDQGFIKRQKFGDLRDFVSRRHTDRAVVTLRPSDTLMAAYGKMKLYDVSQLPVMDEDSTLVGILDETDILMAVKDDEEEFAHRVGDVMSRQLKTVAPTARLDDLIPIFDAGMVPIIADETHFYGLVTRIDVINYLRAGLRTQ